MSNSVASDSGGTETDVAVQVAPTVQDALTAVRRTLAAAKAHAQGARMIEEEGYPVAAILAQLEQRLRALEPGRGVSTEARFGELPGPEAQVTLLLALLELARMQRILLGQREGFGIDAIADISKQLLSSLKTNAPAKNRGDEGSRRKARSAKRVPVQGTSETSTSSPAPPAKPLGTPARCQ